VIQLKSAVDRKLTTFCDYGSAMLMRGKVWDLPDTNPSNLSGL
jgi:hypothetical protein